MPFCFERFRRQWTDLGRSWIHWAMARLGQPCPPMLIWKTPSARPMAAFTFARAQTQYNLSVTLPPLGSDARTLQFHFQSLDLTNRGGCNKEISRAGEGKQGHEKDS